MFIEKIFELVRKEEVIIWAGSGLSKYAGYPSGTELSNLLIDSLSAPEKRKINKKSLLPDLAEEYVRLKGGSRNQLNSILKNVFNKPPTSLRWHELLSKIPHIHTIITTNYDNAFELAYKKDAVKLVTEEDIAYIGDKTEIFKAHGDLGRLDSIIITRGDYANFFYKNTQLNLFWTTLFERVANKSIVFIGYNFEDDNVKNFFEKITDVLKLNRKEAFLIAPKLPEQKRLFLAEKRIQYINFKAEVFIEKLHENIKQNVRSDFENGLIKAETLRSFFKNNGLIVELQSLEDKFVLKSVSGENGMLNGRLHLKLKEGKTIKDELSDVISGKRFKGLEMTSENLLNFKLEASGINLLSLNQNFSVTILPQPHAKGGVDIIFEDQSEISDITYKLFYFNDFIEIVATFKNTTFTISLPREDNKKVRLDYTYEHTGKFEKVKDAIDVYNLLRNLSSGQQIKIFVKALNKEFTFTPIATESLNSFIEPRIRYFSLLKDLETLYKVRFRNIDEPTEEYYQRMLEAERYASGKEVLLDCTDVMFFFELDYNNEGSLSTLKKINDIGGVPITAEHNEKTTLEIHGQLLQLGFQITECCEPFVENLDELINKKETAARIKSKINKVKVKFLRDGLDLSAGSQSGKY